MQQVGCSKGGAWYEDYAYIGGQHRYAVDQYGGGRGDPHARGSARLWYTANVAAAGLPMIFMGTEFAQSGWWCAALVPQPHSQLLCLWPRSTPDLYGHRVCAERLVVRRARAFDCSCWSCVRRHRKLMHVVKICPTQPGSNHQAVLSG